jgi:hypothetical protein
VRGWEIRVKDEGRGFLFCVVILVSFIINCVFLALV